MGTFFAVNTNVSPEKIDLLVKEHESNGFRRIATKTSHNYSFYFFETTANGHGQLIEDGEDFIFSSGTVYSNEHGFGTNALRQALTAKTPAPYGLRGHYCLVRKFGSQLTISNTPISTTKIYVDAHRNVISDSFLSACKLQPSLSLDVIGCYQYVWNGATFGRRTLIEQISALHDKFALRITEQKVKTIEKPRQIVFQKQDYPLKKLDEIAEQHVDRLSTQFRAIANNFDGELRCGLSGGYDSRLIMAMILKEKIPTSFFSFGLPTSFEASIVKDMCDKENVQLDQIDKYLEPKLSENDYVDYTDKNFFAFDGWKVEGLFDNGSDFKDRTDRVANKRVLINGSGGEIYRNFFYLPDCTFSLKHIVWAFYSRYDPEICKDAFDVRTYEYGITEAMKDALEIEHSALRRSEVEALYPLFRCSFWTARDIAINQRFGPALFPYMDDEIISDTALVPIKYKTHGILEGRMIQMINPRLASYNSSYGFAFDRPPPASYKAKMAFSIYRPMFLRRLSYRIKSRIMPKMPYFLQPNYLDKLFDLSYPMMGRLFHVNSIRDPQILNRVSTVEYLCQRLGVN